jgi:hypothetical protein
MSILKLILLGLETGSDDHGRGLAAVQIPMATRGRVEMSEKLVIEVKINNCSTLEGWKERITMQFFQNARNCKRIKQKFRDFPALQVGFVTLRATGVPCTIPICDGWHHNGVCQLLMKALQNGMFGMWDRGTTKGLLTFIQARMQEQDHCGGPKERDAQSINIIYQWLCPVPGIWCNQAGIKNKWTLKEEAGKQVISKKSIQEGIKILEANLDDPIATVDSDSNVKRPRKRRDANLSLTSTNSASASRKRSAEGNLSGKEHEKQVKTKRAEDANKGTNTNKGGFFGGASSA